eukprot:m.158766 g.158766  ORF g.158766 m.158766 type:complete len:74 (+) comp13358_c0_seq6:1334-1555(+)
MTRFNLAHAIDIVKEDEEWMRMFGREKRGYSSLKEFLVRQSQGIASCRRCHNHIHAQTKRVSCHSFSCLLLLL